jgi:hypothetical protein
MNECEIRKKGDLSERHYIKRGNKNKFMAVECGLSVSAFGVRLSVLCFAFGMNLASIAVKTFSHNIYFVKKCCKCAFALICKDTLML